MAETEKILLTLASDARATVVLGCILNTYERSGAYMECDSVAEIKKRLISKGYAVDETVFHNRTGRGRFSITLPDGSIIKIEYNSLWWELSADYIDYHLEYVLSRYTETQHDLEYVLLKYDENEIFSSWVEFCEGISFRRIGYFDLVETPRGHIPAPLFLKTQGYEKILKIPLSEKVRDWDFFTCSGCGDKSFYHPHPCQNCGAGWEAEREKNKDKIGEYDLSKMEYIETPDYAMS